MKKTLKIILVFTLILLLCSSLAPVFGATVAKAEATMTDVRNEEANISFGQYGKFNKKRTDINLENKTIDITLTVENDYVPPTPENKNANIVFLMDASGSMTASDSSHWVTINGVDYTRQGAMFLEANKLADKLLDNSSNVAIAVADFATAWDYTQQGIAENDARVITSTFTNSKTAITNAFNEVKNDSIHDSSHRYYNKTDIEAGLEVVKDFFNSSSSGKLSNATNYVVLFTDGVPNTSLGHAQTSTEYMTAQQLAATKAKIQELEAANIHVHSVLVDISNIDHCDASTDPTIKPLTYREVANRVFGEGGASSGSATYYVTDSNFVNAIENLIYSAILPDPVPTVDLTDVVITDIMPKNIVDNFNFQIISGTTSKLDSSGKVISSTTQNLTPANIAGNITAAINPTTRAITWTFAELPAQTQYTVTYRLSLKDNFDEKILDIDLPTNEDVTIDYKENDTPGDTKHDAHCPAVKLSVQRVNITVEKVWDDNNNNDGIRPESILVQLYANDKASGNPVTLNSENNWKHTYQNLSKLDASGKEIKYTIKEVEVPTGYDATINDYTITNKHIDEKRSIKIDKVWDDANNKDKIRPTSIKVQIYADGEEYGNVITISGDTDWTYTAVDLPKYKNGKEIHYTIKEVEVPPNYTATITGDMDQGFVVKNFHEPEVPPPTPIPQTGENTKLIIGSSMIIIAGIACYSLISLKKKRK